MLTIEKDLGKYLCIECNNLSYWDGYFCKARSYPHPSNRILKFICELILPKRCRFIPPQFSCIHYVPYDITSCKELFPDMTRRVFWCTECNHYNDCPRFDSIRSME